MKANGFGARLVAALWSGLLLCITHGWAPWLAVLAPIPLFWALEKASVRDAFYLGLVCGVGETFIVAGIFYAGVPLYVGMCLTYGLARLAFVMAWLPLARRGAHGFGLVPAALWVLVEWGHALLPYSAPSILGNTQHIGPLLPLAGWGGAYLISGVLVWLSYALWIGVRGKGVEPKERFKPCAVSLGVVGVFVVVANLLAPVHRVDQDALEVAVVQGGVPTWLYDRALQTEDWRDVPERIYRTLSEQADPADLTVWPETAVWRTLGRDAEWEHTLRAVAAEQGGALLVGTPREDEGGAWFNSAVVVDQGAIQTADKRRLALLAEHRFTPGEETPLVSIGGTSTGVVFCLETVVPHYAAALAEQGAQLLVVLAEGSRFGQTQVGRMHAQYSVLRAVETGRPLIHSGQHGFTTVIQPGGERLEPALPFRSMVVRGQVQPSTRRTPFVTLGRWGALVWVAIVLAAIAWALRR